MSALTYFQLESHLAKTISPIYIISGNEILLKQDALTLIRKAAKRAGFSDRNRLIPEAGFDWDHLYTLLFSTSLLAEKQLIELDFRDIAPPKSAHKILEEYGKKPSTQHLLLIDIGKVEPKITKTTWYQALQKTGTVVNIWPISQDQLPQWIIQRAKKYKIQMHANIAQLIADFVEGNLVAAAQAVEKIYLHKPEIINEEFIHRILTDESHFTIFDFSESLISGNKAKVFHILATLKAEGTEPPLILWALTRELRTLADYANQLRQGAPVESILQKQRFSRRRAKIQNFLNKNTVEHCWRYLSRAAHIDKIIKGAEPGNAWNALQLLCLEVGNR